MARLIFFAKPDNDDPDSVKDAGKFKRGDLVDVLPDGADPGREIASSPWWRVIDVPGASSSDFAQLLTRQQAREGIVPRKRLNKIDLDAIEAAAALAMKRQLRTDDAITATKLQLLATVTTKSPDVEDPRVL